MGRLDDGQEVYVRGLIPGLERDAERAKRLMAEAKRLGQHSQSRFEP